MSLSTPQQVLERLETIEQEMASRQLEHEQSAGMKARLIREWDKRLAICMVHAKGSNAETRKAHALVAAIEQDDLYDRLMDAESTYAACSAAERTREKRAMIGQSILKAQGRA